MITPQDQRRQVLLAHRVPAGFLDAIDQSASDPDLALTLRYPESAYDYLPTIADNYQILKGWTITPVYEGSNGDTFWVLLSSPTQFKFVHFELEQDEIYDDFGDNARLMIADFLVGFYETCEHRSIQSIAAMGVAMGLPKAAQLLGALEDAGRQGLRNTFAGDKAWRAQHLKLYTSEG